MSDGTFITRGALDAGAVDFSGIDTGERLAPVHPGDVLLHDFMLPIGLTAHALSLALRLARYFGTSAGFWLNLQMSHEIAVAERKSGARIRAEVSPRPIARCGAMIPPG